MAQDWGLPEKIVYHWRKGTTIPADTSFTAQIKDIIGEPEAEGFEDFELKVQSYAPQWLFLYGDYVSVAYYPIATTGVSGTVTVHLGSYLNTFSPDNKTGNIIFQVFGKPTSGPNAGNRVIIFSKMVTVYVKIYAETQPILLPEKLSFTHELQALAPDYQTVSVDAVGSWEIFLEGTAERYDANGLTGGVTVSTFDLYGMTSKKITGSGSGTFEIRPSQQYLNTLAIGSYSGILSVGYNPNWFNRNTIIETNIVSATEVSADPGELFFHAIKTVSEADSQTIELECDYDFEIEFPSWALVSPSSGMAGAHTISVGVITSDNIDAGTHTGIIKVKYDNGNGLQAFEIPITYLVDGFVVLPYDSNGFNFTLDNKMVSFFTELQNTFYDVKMKIKVFDFFTGISQEHLIPFKIVLFNGRQQDNIGLKIHRVMKRINEIDLTQRKQYKTCEVSLTVEEKDIDTREIQRYFTVEGIKFIAGVSPVLSNGMGILSMYSRPSRIFPKSRQLINLLIASGNNQVVILQNGNVVNSYAVNGYDYNVYMDYIDFSTLDAKEGDVFEYRLYTSVSDYVSKYYLVFPEGNQNLWVVWEDEYKLLSSMPFSGDYNVKTDFENKNFRRYKDLVEIIENIQTNKDVKLNLNTGYILKDEHAVVESIIRSRRAWLISVDDEVTELVPQSKTLTNYDSGRELNAFDVEFIINRKTNEEIHMF